MSVDQELHDLNRKHKIEIRNLDTGANYQLDYVGMKTLGDLKDEIANLSGISKHQQNWVGSIALEDNNNTMSIVLSNCGTNKFSFGRMATTTTTSSQGGAFHRTNHTAASTSERSTSRRPTFPNTSSSNGHSRRSSMTASPSRARSPIAAANNGGAATWSNDSDEDNNYDSDCEFFDAYVDNDFRFNSSNTTMMPENAEDVKAALEQFKTEYLKRYSENGMVVIPDFKTLPLADVIQEAFGGEAKTRKPLAVYLHNDKSIQSNVFCSQIMCQDAVSSFMNSNFVCWAWDMTTDANKNRFLESCKRHFGSGVTESVREIKVDNYPIVMLVQGKGRTCEVTGIMQANSTDMNEMMANMMRAYEHSEQERAQDIREERARKDRERIIREQEDAYQRSLEIDRQKRIKKEQEDLRIETENRRKQNAEQVKQEEIARLRSLVPPEPTAKSGKPICQIRFRAPKGVTINRSFFTTDTLQSLVDFVGSQGYLHGKYQIIKSFPKTNISALDLTKTLENSGISKREAVTIEEVESNSDESDDDEC